MQGSSASTKPTFDVVSIRESAPDHTYSQYASSPPHSGSFEVRDFWMTQIIASAYGVNFRTTLVGGPDWIGTRRFNIQARTSPEEDRALAAMKDDEAHEAKQAMLRAMLAERFGLKAHFEMRPATVYTMTVARPSPNLKRSPPGDLSQDELGIRSYGEANRIELRAHQVSMEKLANMMGFYLHNEVYDRTELTGAYDFDVAFNPHPDLQTDTPDAAPPAEVAFLKQLGLRLLREKVPVKTLVVDALSMPSPN